MSAQSFRILVVGCGQLGSRHLQAVAALPIVREIEVVDPRPEALAMGRERVADVTDRNRAIEFRWMTSLEEACRGGDLCLVATQAAGRCQLVREVAERLGYRRFLLEKIVGQSVQEIEDLQTFLASHEMMAWVNFKTRAYPVHQTIRQRLDPQDPLLFHAMGGNHGLANNGVHTADLFVCYDGARQIDLTGSCVDPILHPSKRSRELFDLSGTIQGSTERGSHFVLSYARDHVQSEQIAITTQRYRAIVDHMQRWAVESDAASGWGWRALPFEGNLLVSHMTRAFATEILTSGRCELPTLEESLIAHRFILGALQAPFSRLLERQVEACPVT